MISRALIAFFSFSIALPAVCQVRNLKFEHKGIEDGLSHSNVICILQDSRGFMWLGTRNGLNKYDGYTFTIYKNNIEDANSLSNDRIADLLEDEDGNIWIATIDGGLDMFDWKHEKFIHYRHNPDDLYSLPLNNLHSITADYEGNLWIGTAGGGLCMLDRKTDKFARYLHDENDPTSVPSNSVNDVLEDSDHNLWISTISNGLSLFDRKTKKFKHFINDPKDAGSLLSDKLEVLFQDSKNRIWIGTRSGLSLFNGTEFRHFKHDPNNVNSLGSNIVLSIEEDQEGNLWVGTENGGLSILNLETEIFSNYFQDDIDSFSLNNNSIWSLYKDAHGNMWVGTFSGGINFANRSASKFAHYRHTSSPTSLSNNSVWTIFEDSNMNLWIGTDGGGANLFDRKNGTFKAYKTGIPSQSIAGNYVLSIAEDRHGNIWMGTWGNGITMFNPKKNTFRHFDYSADNPHGISSPNVWIIYKDREHQMWIGTYSGGVDIYNEKEDNFIHFRNDLADTLTLGSNTVSSFLEDTKGTMWIASTGGLNRFNKTKKNFTRFTHVDRANSISNNRVLCMAEDRLGNLWVGTEIGLNYFDTKTHQFTNYYKKDGLPDNSINGLLIDEDDNLWISTNNGVSRFNPNSKVFKNFGMSDGLQSTEFKKGACRSRTGQMYFAGTGGLNEFTPRHIKPDSSEYPLLFTGFEIFNKPVPISEDADIDMRIPQSISASTKLQLSYKQNVFSIQFASLNYTTPENKKYSYRLEGFERGWNNLSGLHAATYTNLDPGSYTFKVRGLNNDGDWSRNIAELKINITPPFWKTWWFKLFLGIFMASMLILVFILRTRNMARLNRELMEAVDEKTREINDKNKILFQQREELATQNEELILSHEEISAQRDMVAKQNETLESEVEKRTRELVEYNHQLEQFAFIAAHNLRAPVARILGLGNLLDISNQKETDREQIYPRIVNATRELDTVVKDLNTILYLKKNSDSVITLIDLETEVALIVGNLQHEISLTHAEITTDFSNISSIHSVKPYLDSIIYNLLSNAIKYRHPDRNPKIHIKSEKVGKEICLNIIDNGLGIDVDLFQDKLFTLYSRFHLHVEGKGMGLYLVKNQLAAMGGRVEVVSQVDVGTTFKVYFKDANL